MQGAAIRRKRLAFSPWGSTALHAKNPWVVAFWSFAFPGCGHLMQGRLLIGMVLICWEIVINMNAKINSSIFHTLTGRFDQAIAVINPRWFMLYFALYIFAIWDSYRGTMEMNRLYLLADREDARIRKFAINNAGTAWLDRKNPVLASLFSILAPGLGHFYVHQSATGIFFVLWTTLVMYFSKALPGLHYSLTGDFGLAIATVDMQWLMFLPSIACFVAHDAYVQALEFNKMMEKEQSFQLRAHFQSANHAREVRDPS